MGGHAAAREGERKGDFLGGKYLLEDCLGIGGMGEVYRAQNVSLGRKVAIKLLNKEHTSNEDDVMRFLREARAAAAIRHPNVVDVFDVARDDDGTPFIVQELLSGQDLEQYLGASDGRLAAGEAHEIMIPVADAVAAAHRQNVVHRDLKPANIFLAREGNKIIPKVLDFGACLYQTVGALSAKEQRMLIGTPHYMAPEQISTAMDVDARADVWAMGVILYELLVGDTPFEAADANAVLKLVRTRSVQRVRDLVASVPEELDALVAHCLDRDRKKRFADAAVMREELDKVRRSLRGLRKRVDTPELASAAKLEPKSPAPSSGGARGDRRVDPRADDDDDDARPSTRVPSLVIRGGKLPTKRRGSALLTLSAPDEAVSWDSEPPQSLSRPIEASKPARTAADVIREAEEAVQGKSTSTADAPDLPPRALALPSTPPPRPPETGAPRDLEFDDTDDPTLDLDLRPPVSRRPATSGHSSIPPVLDPRAASRTARSSDRPEPYDSGSKLRTSSSGTGTQPGIPPALTPPISPMRVRTPGIAMAIEAPRPWSAKARLELAAAIVVPALVAFFALTFAPSILAPLDRAMRGDSPLASGLLAVVTLVGAAALAARSFGSSRSAGMTIATVGAVLLGVVMIIVTFSASETVELGAPPAVGGIVPFIAPIIPLGLGLAALRSAVSGWRSPYERSEAIRFVALTSIMLLAMLELGPLGSVRAATSAPAPAPPALPAHSGP